MDERDERDDGRQAEEAGTPVHDPAAPGPPPAWVVLAAASFLYLVLFFGGWIWIRARGEAVPLAGRWGLGIETGLGVALGAAVAAASAGLARVSAAARALEEKFRSILGALGPGEALVLACLSGFAEEVLFRGALQPAVGLAAASLIFGLLHVGPERVYLPWTVFAVAMGFVLGGLFAWTGGLAAPVAVHVTVNAINLVRLGSPPDPAPRFGGDDARPA